MLRIDIRPLKPGVHEFEWEPPADALELDPGVFRDLHVRARLDYHPAHIYVTMHTRATAHLVCDRTLVDFTQEVSGEYRVLYSSDEAVNDDASDDNVRFLAPDEDEIDITEVVRDTFMLSLPYRRLAPGAESKEIPLRFGAPDPSSEIDPRWEALRDLGSDRPDASRQ